MHSVGALWNFLVRSAGTAVALWVVTEVVAGVSVYGSHPEQRWVSFLGSAAVIVVLNMTVRPALRLLGLQVHEGLAGGAVLGKGQLGVGMQVAPQRHQVGQQVSDVIGHVDRRGEAQRPASTASASSASVR